MRKHTHRQIRRAHKWTPKFKREWNRRYARKYRATHRRKVARYNRSYRQRNPEKIRALRNRWYLQHRAQEISSAKNRASKDRDRVRRYNRKYGREHRKEANARRWLRRRANPAKYRKVNRSWYWKNREKALRQQAKAHAALTPGARYLKNLRNSLRAKYKLSVEEFEKMNRTQKGKCAVCGRPPRYGRKRLDVDHDHKKQVTRGLLCSQCNNFLHFIETHQERIPALFAYLKRYQI